MNRGKENKFAEGGKPVQQPMGLSYADPHEHSNFKIPKACTGNKSYSKLNNCLQKGEKLRCGGTGERSCPDNTPRRSPKLFSPALHEELFEQHSAQWCGRELGKGPALLAWHLGTDS